MQKEGPTLVMNILIIHPSFAGQFVYLAPYLAQNPENQVVFLAKENSMKAELPGVRLALYKPPRAVGKETHHYLTTATEAVLEGQQTVRALDGLRRKGFVPDVIVGHTGWGSLLYCKDIYPDVPVLGYFEWYYLSEHSDSYWWPDEVPEIDAKLAIRSKNMHHLLSLESCDLRMTPTKWQLSRFPKHWQERMVVQHDGTDTVFCCPPEGERPGLDLKFTFDDKEQELHLPQGTEIITYVSRGFEAMRGFPQFMDAMRIVLKNRPQAHVVCMGNDRICYGAALKDTTYLKEERKKGGYDEARIHFIGSTNRRDYKKVMQASSCHVYLTRPFILSWSMLEAMSFGLPLVASKTPPCEEVVEDGVNGLLAEFRSPHHIARRVEEILDDRALAERLGKAARETVLERYDLTHALRREEDLIYSLVK